MYNVCSFSFFWTDNAPGPSYVKILISSVEKKMNENYVEFDFRMGSVFVIFLFFLTDNITPDPPPH